MARLGRRLALPRSSGRARRLEFATISRTMRQRVLVLDGVVVGHAGDARVNVGTAELLGVTSSPVAAFTSGGPPRRSCPCS